MERRVLYVVNVYCAWHICTFCTIVFAQLTDEYCSRETSGGRNSLEITRAISRSRRVSINRRNTNRIKSVLRDVWLVHRTSNGRWTYAQYSQVVVLRTRYNTTTAVGIASLPRCIHLRRDVRGGLTATAVALGGKAHLVYCGSLPVTTDKWQPQQFFVRRVEPSEIATIPLNVTVRRGLGRSIKYDVYVQRRFQTRWTYGYIFNIWSGSHAWESWTQMRTIDLSDGYRFDTFYHWLMMDMTNYITCVCKLNKWIQLVGSFTIYTWISYIIYTFYVRTLTIIYFWLNV